MEELTKELAYLQGAAPPPYSRVRREDYAQAYARVEGAELVTMASGIAARRDARSKPAASPIVRLRRRTGSENLDLVKYLRGIGARARPSRSGTSS